MHARGRKRERERKSTKERFENVECVSTSCRTYACCHRDEGGWGLRCAKRMPALTATGVSCVRGEAERDCETENV